MTTDLGGPASAANSVTSRPADGRTFGASDTWFKDCSSSTAQDGTALGASTFNQWLAMIRALIRGAGITPDNTNDNMMLQAVQSMGSPYAVDSGGVNALVVDVATPGFSLTAGKTIKVKVGNTVTGPATIDVKNGGVDIATYNITRRDLSALNPYDLMATEIASLTFDGAQFQLARNIDGGTGDVKLTLKTAADPGWVMMTDGTIGSAASGATILASAACAKLYALVWGNISNTFAPVTGGRGANAAADFAANKPIQLLAAVGRAIALAGSGAGLTARTLGQNLGEELHVLITAELASHSHTASVTDPTHPHSTLADANINPTVASTSANPSLVNAWGGTTGFAATGITVSNASTGSGTGHNTMQPTVFMNAMARL